MNITDIIKREVPPSGRAGAKIPWDDPAFSRRMLASHLAQEHDWASRRGTLIDRQVEYISRRLPEGAAVLDLGCGPGLYLERLAVRGHDCVGVDFSPAAVDYARARAAEIGRHIAYIPDDIRTFSTAALFDAVLLLFGEINVFSRADASAILQNACAFLRPGGLLFMEAHSFDEVRRQGLEPPSWQSCETGLFSEKPHLCLSENFWDENAASATTRYYILDAQSAECVEYASSMCAYTQDEYADMLKTGGAALLEIPTAQEWPAGEDFAGRLELLVAQKQ